MEALQTDSLKCFLFFAWEMRAILAAHIMYNKKKKRWRAVS
jgi:hypothetical protein